MIERYSMNDSEPVAFSFLSKDKRTAMTKLVKSTASLCSMHDLDFIYFANEHELGVGKDLSG